MTQKQLREKGCIVKAIARTAHITLQEAERIARRLHAINSRLDWWNEQRCCREGVERWWTLGDDGEYHNPDYDKDCDNARRYIEKALPGVKYFINDDPLGPSVRLYLDEYRNAMDGSTGICWRF